MGAAMIDVITLLLDTDNAITAALDKPASPDTFDSLAPRLWAVSEMLNAIMDHPFDDPEVIVERFWIKMNAFCAKSKSKNRRLTFWLAADTAESILASYREGVLY